MQNKTYLCYLVGSIEAILKDKNIAEKVNWRKDLMNMVETNYPNKISFLNFLNSFL